MVFQKFRCIYSSTNWQITSLPSLQFSNLILRISGSCIVKPHPHVYIYIYIYIYVYIYIYIEIWANSRMTLCLYNILCIIHIYIYIVVPTFAALTPSRRKPRIRLSFWTISCKNPIQRLESSQCPRKSAMGHPSNADALGKTIKSMYIHFSTLRIWAWWNLWTICFLHK